VVLEHEGEVDDGPAAGLEDAVDFKESASGVPYVFESLAAEDEIVASTLDGGIANVTEYGRVPLIIAVEGIKMVGGEEGIIVAGSLLVPPDSNVKHSPLSGGIKLLGVLGELFTLDLPD